MDRNMADLRELHGQALRLAGMIEARATDLENFLRRLSTEGGRIVCTNTLTPEQINEAREAQRLLVLDDGIGFALMPAGVIPSGGTSNE
jgi:hypothetical protein